MRLLALVVALCIPAVGLAAPAAPPKAPLDDLFVQLSKAGSEEEAKPIEQQIETAFLQSGSPTVDLLMSRGNAALQAGDSETAKQLYDSVTGVAPGYAEGWHYRAQLQAAAGEDEAAMVSLQKAVTLNPRQFAALAQLADMLEDYGDKKGALAMYRRALALDPNLPGVARHVRGLERDVEGEKI